MQIYVKDNNRSAVFVDTKVPDHTFTGKEPYQATGKNNSTMATSCYNYVSF